MFGFSPAGSTIEVGFALDERKKQPKCQSNHVGSVTFGHDPGLGAVTGLDSDLGKFKVPTLRNIAQTAPYMHDGRLSTLLEVVEHCNSGVDSMAPNLDPDMHVYSEGLNLTAQQKFDLVAFMESFTDEAFLSNPAFSAP